MDYLSEGPSFIPFTKLIRKSSYQSQVHLSSREEGWMLKENNLIFSQHGLNTSLQEGNLPSQNLKRAIFTIVLPCTQILVVNSAACKLLNYSSSELCSMKLQNLVEDNHKYKFATLSEHLMSDSTSSGNKKEKHIELVSKDGDVIPASIYFKKIDSPARCLAVVEPIDRKTAVLTVSDSGQILTCDDESTSIFHYNSSDLVGMDIRKIIPHISLYCDGEKHEIVYKQRLTGKTRRGVTFPLCLVISKSNPHQRSWQVVIWVFLSLSGLIILDKDYCITNCNYQFMKLLFGASREDILDQNITKFIPSFCDDVKHLGRNPQSSGENIDALWRKESVKWGASAVNSQKKSKDKNGKQLDCKSSFIDLPLTSAAARGNCQQNSLQKYNDHCRSWNRCNCKHRGFSGERNLINVRLSKSDHDIRRECDSGPCTADDKSVVSRRGPEASGAESDDRREPRIFNADEFNTHLRTKQKNGDYYFDYKHLGLREGYFSGNGKHWDGNEINIYYKVKIISFAEKLFYCIWISKDLGEINDVSPIMPTTVTGSSSVNSASMDETTTKDTSYNDELTRHSSASLISHNDEVLTGGEYAENYTNIEQIGKGGFGYVKMAFRHSDGLLVVTKFIKKHKINVQSWVFDPNWNVKIPLEISLLTNLKHPNIIEVLDVFHNESFFQLVMKKHGAGIDLFEYIERKPNSDEKLNSYIFRQIISAVQYLDSIGILHRDIKDENVIINEKFDVKLIDFGSAAFRPPGKMFSVFYGTVEYCSPEVLEGNKYRGPELEIWALGVTLYVLIFGENPFYDVQETIKGHFTLPLPISSYLFDLLHKMLEKDVDSRITIGRVASHPWITQPVDINNYRFEEVVHCSPAEADPPRYITEFKFESRLSHDSDVDGDRTMASSNSFCSLQTTENTENFDQYDESLQDFDGDFLTDDGIFASTPISSGASKTRDHMTKSAGALNKVCENPLNYSKSQICDRCNYKNAINKRFSLDINILKRLGGAMGAAGSGTGIGGKCSDSECSCEPMINTESRDSINEKQEPPKRRHLIGDTDEMRLPPISSDSKSYFYDSDAYNRSSIFTEDESRVRSTTRDTDESNLTADPDFYDTSDSRSCDEEESDFFWDAENDKIRGVDGY